VKTDVGSLQDCTSATRGSCDSSTLVAALDSVERVVEKEECCGITVRVCKTRVSIHLVLEFEPENKVARNC
jgi:hypothetical protein